MKPHDFPQEFATEAAKGLPPVAVAAASVTGTIDWQTWVYILTAFYLVLQILWLAWKAADKFMGKDSEED